MYTKLWRAQVVKVGSWRVKGTDSSTALLLSMGIIQSCVIRKGGKVLGKWF